MSFFKSREYSESPALTELALRIANSAEELEVARIAKWKILYSSVELDHIGGKCKIVQGTEKYHTKLNFNILIHRPPFVKDSTRDKFRIIAHELYHMEQPKKAFKIRHHGGDFCEIAEHDAFSYGLADKALEALKVVA